MGTCFTYRIKLLRRVSGTVTEIASANIADGNIGGSLTIGYVQVVTNTAGQITATAQMSTGGTIAQIQQTPTATRANRHGMIIAPATANQSSGLERFVYTSAV
jgi:translation initiation factor 6 (eIF-6)